MVNRWLKRAKAFGMFALVISYSIAASSQETEGGGAGVLSDGKLTKEELAAAMLTAEKDMTSMLKASMSEVEKEVEASGVFGPGAWMVLKDRSLKQVKLDEVAEEAPPSAKLQIIRASLRSLARHNKIDAAMMVYPGTINKDGTKDRVVVVEHEHRLGVSGIKLVPLSLVEGEVTFGAAISQEKSFQIFYDQRKTDN